MPRPPSRAGSANKFLSVSLKAFWPVRCGRKTLRMVSLRGLMSSAMFEVVLARYVHLLVSPCVNTANAACGWVMAMEERRSSSDTQVVTFCCT